MIVDEDGASKISVESGWVIISINEFDSYVPKNFNCLISRGRYAIPYPFDSPTQLSNILQNFSGINDPALGTILQLVTSKEALSLWHIIQLISPESRVIAFDTLNGLMPLPVRGYKRRHNCIK